jgi:hypothetical protein
MASTTRARTHQVEHPAAATIRWKTWPLKDQRRGTWFIVLGTLAVASAVWYVGGSGWFALAAVVGLAGSLWQFFLPVGYELDALGVRRFAIGHSRLMPWHAVRAYQLRPTGVVLYQCAEPTKFDLLRSVFVPYPAEEDELICALREHLPHAAELPQ